MRQEKPRWGLTAFVLAVAIPTFVGLLWVGVSNLHALDPDLLWWVGVVAMVELLPVPAWRGLQVSVAFPLLLAVAILYDPASAGLIALVGSFDPREFKGEVSLLRAAFNRAQSALAVVAASAMFHALGNVEDTPSLVIAAAVVAGAVDYIVNVSLVTMAAAIDYRLKPWAVARELHIGKPAEFLLSYFGLGFLGVVLAKLYIEVGFWSVAVFVVPLIFARQMFFRSRALEEAHKELQDRAAVLRALSNRMAEERQDERSQIAAYLHDDLAQLLFRLSLQVEVVERLLKQGNIEQVEKTLAEVKETKNLTSERIRALVRDLHRSPLGRAGLAESLKSFTHEVGDTSSVEFSLEVADLALPPPIQLLIYQIAREGIMNSLKYAEASEISVSLDVREGLVELVVRDDGKGFDSEAGEPEGHYGLTMMRERAQVAGGTFDLVSAVGHGTGIVVRFPASWLQADGARSTTGTAEQPAAADPTRPEMQPGETQTQPGLASS